MREVVSVSLGSSQRDHEVEIDLLGERFRIRRIGTDGESRRARELLAELDGQVDAIGLGGVDVYLWSRTRRYELRHGRRLLDVLKKTPAADGSGLKNTLERETVRQLLEDGRIPLAGRRVLMVCAMDRFGMAQALEAAGGRMVYGDLIFSLGLDKPLTSLDELEEQADRLLPEISKMPISMLYPVGRSQSEIEPSSLTDPYYREAEVIAGDFHFIRRRMPPALPGKTILTNTVTRQDVELLRQRGVSWLVTTTPELEGRSFGTNVLEAVFLALLGKPWEQVTPGDYLSLIRRLDLKPRIQRLDEERLDEGLRAPAENSPAARETP